MVSTTKGVCSLDGEWMLYFTPEPLVGGVAPQTIRELEASPFQRIPCRVPGNVEEALEEAGVIGNPFYADNTESMQAYEYVHYFYARTFLLEEEPERGARILLEGVDTFATVFLNGMEIGTTDNMLIEHTIDTRGLLGKSNELVLHIKPTVLRAREYSYSLLNLAIKYNYDSLFVRKTASMFGWDIMPRLVSAGIWRSVSLLAPQSAVRFEQVYLYTESISEDKAALRFFYEVELGDMPANRYQVRLAAECDGHAFSFETAVWGKCGKERVLVESPKLWWPKGHGEPALYTVRVDLLDGETIQDTRIFATGIRTVALERTSVVDPEGNGEFCFRVNDRKIFVLGTNWVPPDALPARGDTRAPEILTLVEEIGCNCIRIWGGGRYEKEEFYEACDRKGILVWHDFMMACGNYPQTQDFEDRLSVEIRQIVRRLRHHPSILLWAGDNECDMNYMYQLAFSNPERNTLTRNLIPSLLLNEDYTRPYLPSSPYIDQSSWETGPEHTTENHLWGPRRYFKAPYYRDAKAVFASEIGYHGCPSPESIRRFLSPQAVWPPLRNREWLLHSTSPDPKESEPFGYRTQLMLEQVRVLFGEIPETLPLFSAASQISQAEAMQFFIERFRMRKWAKTGIIWWNICDGWPQFSDAVVDYYYTKKLAYAYIRRSQNPVCLMLDDSENGVYRIIAANDTPQDVLLSYTVTGMEAGMIYAKGDILIPCNSAVTVGDFADPQNRDFVRIAWQGGDEGMNTHLLGEPEFQLADYIRWAGQAGVFTLEGFSPEDREAVCKISVLRENTCTRARELI